MNYTASNVYIIRLVCFFPRKYPFFTIIPSFTLPFLENMSLYPYKRPNNILLAIILNFGSVYGQSALPIYDQCLLISPSSPQS
jgi:hypothetical protein